MFTKNVSKLPCKYTIKLVNLESYLKDQCLMRQGECNFGAYIFLFTRNSNFNLEMWFIDILFDRNDGKDNIALNLINAEETIEKEKS